MKFSILLRLFSRANVFNAAGVGLALATGRALLMDSTKVTTGQAGLAFLMACVCLIFGNLDRLESVKASATGLEAKTREIVAKAEVSLAQLQRLAVQLAALAIESNASQGRWDSGDGRDRDARRAAALSVLRELNVPEDQISIAAAADRKWVIVDYLHTMMNVCHFTNAENPQVAGVVSVVEIINSIRDGFLERNEPPPPADILQPKVRGFLNSPLLERWIASYETYRATGNHGEPSLWAQREDYHLDIALKKHGPKALL